MRAVATSSRFGVVNCVHDEHIGESEAVSGQTYWDGSRTAFLPSRAPARESLPICSYAGRRCRRMQVSAPRRSERGSDSEGDYARIQGTGQMSTRSKYSRKVERITRARVAAVTSVVRVDQNIDNTIRTCDIAAARITTIATQNTIVSCSLPPPGLIS